MEEGAGEMAHWSRASGTLPEEFSSQHTGGSQPSIALAQGDLMPSSGILIHACAYLGTGTCTYKQK